MKSVRVHSPRPGTFEIDVVCDCGKNALTHTATGKKDFRHEICTGSIEPVVLACDCGKKFNLVSQHTHIHVGHAEEA